MKKKQKGFTFQMIGKEKDASTSENIWSWDTFNISEFLKSFFISAKRWNKKEMAQ